MNDRLSPPASGDLRHAHHVARAAFDRALLQFDAGLECLELSLRETRLRRDALSAARRSSDAAYSRDATVAAIWAREAERASEAADVLRHGIAMRQGRAP